MTSGKETDRLQKKKKKKHLKKHNFRYVQLKKKHTL